MGVDQHSEAAGYATFYAEQRAHETLKIERAKGYEAVRWLLDFIVEECWNDSVFVIEEGMTAREAPHLVLKEDSWNMIRDLTLRGVLEEAYHGMYAS